jgi:RNA polymerase-binding transcription factor DksA
MDRLASLWDDVPAQRSADEEARLFARLEGALRRLYDGSFGTCFECGSAIEPPNADSASGAARCASCQSIADRQVQARLASAGASSRSPAEPSGAPSGHASAGYSQS